MKTNTKEWVQYSSAIFMLLTGVILAFLSFFFRDDITENVLWYVGQTIVYAASVFSVSIYVKGVVDKAIGNFKNLKDTTSKAKEEETKK